MTNIPVTAEQVAAMAADASTYLFQSLGLRVKAPSFDNDARRARAMEPERKG